MIITTTVTESDGTVLAHHRTEIPAITTQAIEGPGSDAGLIPNLPLRQRVYLMVESSPGIRAAIIAIVLGDVKNDQGQLVDTGKVSKDGVSQILTDLKKEGLVANGLGEFNSWEWTVTDKVPPWGRSRE
jgi:hypothetical protein